MSGRRTHCRRGHELAVVGVHGDGRYAQCKREYNRRYYKLHRERVRANQADYHAAHRDAIRERKREHYRRNRAEILKRRGQRERRRAR